MKAIRFVICCRHSSSRISAYKQELAKIINDQSSIAARLIALAIQPGLRLLRRSSRLKGPERIWGWPSFEANVSVWRRWRYPKAERLIITADGGGSNRHRVRLWKLELSRFAQEAGLDIEVLHFPSGAHKWNKIEHRLFSFITLNWRGQPLISHEVMVSTKTRSGLTVRSEIDNTQYLKGLTVSDTELAAIKIEKLCAILTSIGHMTIVCC